METVLYLVSPADELLRGRISKKTEQLAGCALKTLEGVNVRIPDGVRHKLEVRPEQTHVHYEPRRTESIQTLWDICDDLHRLNAMAFKVENSELKKELQTDIHDLTIMILRLLHWS